MGENEMSILLIILYALMSASFFVLAALADGKTVKVLNSVTAVCWLVNCILTIIRELAI